MSAWHAHPQHLHTAWQYPHAHTTRPDWLHPPKHAMHPPQGMPCITAHILQLGWRLSTTSAAVCMSHERRTRSWAGCWRRVQASAASLHPCCASCCTCCLCCASCCCVSPVHAHTLGRWGGGACVSMCMHAGALTTTHMDGHARHILGAHMQAELGGLAGTRRFYIFLHLQVGRMEQTAGGRLHAMSAD